MADAVFRGSREELTAMIGKLNEALAGVSNGFESYVRPIYDVLGVSLLSSIQQAFIVKSRGGTGSDGIQWEPLKPETIAQRRIGTEDLLAIGVKGNKIPANRVRGLLTPDQDARWRKIFHQVYMRNVFEMGDAAAKAKAGSVAWTILKEEGAQTKLMVLGGRVVDILRDTGVLFRSLSPSIAGFEPEGQVFEIEPGSVTVGTNIKPYHHRGIPGKLPARPFWPLDGSIPDAWWSAMMNAVQKPIGAAIAAIVSQQRI
jgi:hypothetical protein